jgi:hypothetical protein
MLSEQELLNCAEEMRIHLEEWQRDIIFDRTTKRWCLNCGRKRGKTTAIEFRTVMRLLNDDVQGNGLIGGIAIVSEEFKAAKQILAGIKTIFTALGWRFVDDMKFVNEAEKKAFATVSEVKLPSGNRVMCFPAGRAGDNIRPYTFHEFIYDEADFIPNDVYVSTGPCLARFDGVEILESTPNIMGDRNTYFAQAYFGQRPDYKVYHLPSTEAAHLPAGWIERERRTKTAREFAREILAEFVSDISSVFPNELIQSCIQEDIEWIADAAFIGAKYARFDQENSVIAENFYRDGISYLRIGILPQYGRRILEAENQIVSLVNANGISRVVIDNTSLGRTPIDSLAQLLGLDMVIGVQNHETVSEAEGLRSRYMKEDLYVNLLKLMERGQIKFSDKRIEAALMDVHYDYSKRNKQVWIFGNDIADALVRAVFPVWGRREWLDKSEKLQIYFKKF